MAKEGPDLLSKYPVMLWLIARMSDRERALVEPGQGWTTAIRGGAQL